MDRHTGRACLTGYDDEITHLECGSRGGGQCDVDGEHLVEPTGLTVSNERFEDRRFEALGAPLGEGVPDLGEECHARLLEVGEIVRMVHDRHRIGLDETDADVMGELVVVGIGGRIDGQTHTRESARKGAARQNGDVTPAIVLLEQSGIEFGIHEYDRGEDLRDFGREAAEALGVAFEQVFKTLLIDTEGGDAPRDPVVVVVPVSCTVSMKLAAAAVGAKKASMCDPDAAERITGYVVGGISPFGQRKRLVTVIDESVLPFETVYVSGGKRGLDISLAPAHLVSLLGAIVAPITA